MFRLFQTFGGPSCYHVLHFQGTGVRRRSGRSRTLRSAESAKGRLALHSCDAIQRQATNRAAPKQQKRLLKAVHRIIRVHHTLLKPMGSLKVGCFCRDPQQDCIQACFHLRGVEERVCFIHRITNTFTNGFPKLCCMCPRQSV